jgi:hypothetical protein
VAGQDETIFTTLNQGYEDLMRLDHVPGARLRGGGV